MRKPNDWRLTNQERYLKNVTLYWERYHPTNPNNDHDHCEFCLAKFMDDEYPDTLHEGYTTLDGYRWVCRACFEDFKDLFLWQVKQPS